MLDMGSLGGQVDTAGYPGGQQIEPCKNSHIPVSDTATDFRIGGSMHGRLGYDSPAAMGLAATGLTASGCRAQDRPESINADSAIYRYISPERIGPPNWDAYR